MSLLPDPLHPAIVHFPIALTFVAVLVELLARHRRARSLEGAGALLIGLAAVAAVVAVVTGNAAHDDAVVPPAAAALVARHEQVGETAMWLLLALAAARLLLAQRGWFKGAVPWLYLAGVALGAATVGYNGYLGGKMVFEHGLGTAPVQRGAAPAPAGGGSSPATAPGGTPGRPGAGRAG